MSTDDFYDARLSVGEALYQLDHIRSAAWTLGNTTLADKLDQAVHDIRVAIAVMENEYHDQIHERFNDAQASSRNLLSAVLSGIQLGKEDHDREEETDQG